MINNNQNKEPLSDVLDTVVSQPPGKIFRWPKGIKITAIDMVVIALPKVLFQDNEIMSSVIDCDDGMNVSIHPNSDKVFFYVQPGMSLTLKKSSETYIVANDDSPRRIRITRPKADDR